MSQNSLADWKAEFTDWLAHTTLAGQDRHAAIRDWIDKIAAAAAQEEREACAVLAETWCECPDIQDGCTGCMAAYNEGQDCGASEGIAKAIRARGGLDA